MAVNVIARQDDSSATAPTVFWSWQNDYEPTVCRHFIRPCLKEASEVAGEELGLEDAERPELDHDTKNERGMVDIIATILQKIDRAAVFVADVTPIAKDPAGKAVPNPNVMIELGWAMRSIGPESIICILNAASGFKPDDLPFDIRHRRTMVYHLARDADAATKAKVKEDLTKKLTEAIATNLGAYLEGRAASVEIVGVAAKADNPSIWASGNGRIELYDYFRGQQKTVAQLPDVARAYIRAIPAGWRNGVAGISEIKTLPDPVAVRAPLGEWSYSDYGACEDGYVNYGFTTPSGSADLREVRDAVMFFDTNGEFWALHGSAIGRGPHGATIKHEAVLGYWAKFIRRVLQVYESLGANPVCSFEAGLYGVRGVRWPGQWADDSPPSRKNEFRLRRQHRSWTEEIQLTYLVDAFNGMLDLFGIPKASKEEVQAIINKMGPFV